MTGPKRFTLFDRIIETVNQAQAQKVPVYLTRQDWRRLRYHLTRGSGHLPITDRLIVAIDAALSPPPTRTPPEQEGQ
jgi:hypothetical protein